MKRVHAQDEFPTEEELVKEFKESPQANWKEFLQPIIRELQNLYGTKVVLVGPELEAPFGSAEAGFNIRGFLRFPEGRPLEIKNEFGDNPIVFRAYVANGGLVQPIFLDFE